MIADDPHLTASSPIDPIEHERWLEGIVRLAEGAKLRGVHPVTLKRDAVKQKQLLQLGERAVGVRRRFALMIPPQGDRAGIKPERPRERVAGGR
jgi:hypothetical protein